MAQNNFKLKGQINWYNAQDIGVEVKGGQIQKDILIVYPEKQRVLFETQFGIFLDIQLECVYDLKRIHQTYISVINYI